MQSEPLFDLPTAVKNLIAKAEEAGWNTYVTYADLDGLSVCVRFADPRSERRAYGIWQATPTDKGKLSIKVFNVGCNDFTTKLSTVKALTAYLLEEDFVHA